MHIFLVRHGETDANSQGIVQGWLDTELNKKGITQGIEAANNFNERIDVIYSSDLKRAVRTAQEFRSHNKSVPYYEDIRLRERNFGEAAGTHRDDHDWEQFWSIEDRSTIRHAETLNDFTQRVREFLNELKEIPYSSVLIITHGGVLNRVQAIFDSNHVHYPHKNASILEIDV
jgi:alpha-ribazole phosphatase